MKKRTIFLILFIGISFIVQAVGLSSLKTIESSHDIEFTYTYNYNIEGTGGIYLYDTIEYRSSGRVIVDFDESLGIATVTRDDSWTYEEIYDYETIDYDEDTDHITFTYNLSTGEYISDTDQEYDTTEMNVWFHIPGGIQKPTYNVLDDRFTVNPPSTFWVSEVMPVKAEKLTAAGEYDRSDAFINATNVKYSTELYYTKEGYYIGDIAHEEPSGTFKGQYASFTFNSRTEITSSSYVREFDWTSYFLAYWLWVVVYCIVFYVIYEILRWRTQTFVIDGHAYRMDKSVPANLPIMIDSKYQALLTSYLLRARTEKAQCVSVYDNEGVRAIGLIEPDVDVATFFAGHPDLVYHMRKFMNVANFFTELNLPGFVSVEQYNIWNMQDLSQLSLEYDSVHIRPMNPNELGAVKGLISVEDYGKNDARLVKWVDAAAKLDLVYVATLSTQEDWGRNMIQQMGQQKYPLAQISQTEYLAGVGFATVGENVGWLYGLYVHPAFRNRGIGKNLVLARLSALSKLNIHSAMTEIAQWNAPAQNLYKPFNPTASGTIKLFGKTMPKVKFIRHH